MNGLDVSRWDQPDRVAELGDLAAPVVSAATGLQSHRTGRQRCQEGENLTAPQLLAKHNSSGAVSPMKLKDGLGEIQPNSAHLVHGRLLEWVATPPLWHADAVGGVHPIKARGRARLGGTEAFLNHFSSTAMPPPFFDSPFKS